MNAFKVEVYFETILQLFQQRWNFGKVQRDISCQDFIEGLNNLQALLCKIQFYKPGASVTNAKSLLAKSF